MFIDSHCHLDRLQLSDHSLEEVLANARGRGVSRFLSVSTDLLRFPGLMALADQFEDVFISAGVHPLSKELGAVEKSALLEAAKAPKCIAVGETGLDYHYQADTQEAQQRAFRLHLEVADELGKPVIVHTREAKADTLRLIRESGNAQWGGVLHCFTEDWEMAKAALDLNYCISFSGIVSFRNAAPLREVAKQVPMDRILIETDAPYLTPVPYRGKANEPKFVCEVAACLAEVKGVSVEELAEQSSANFFRLFHEAS